MVSTKNSLYLPYNFIALFIIRGIHFFRVLIKVHTCRRIFENIIQNTYILKKDNYHVRGARCISELTHLTSSIRLTECKLP